MCLIEARMKKISMSEALYKEGNFVVIYCNNMGFKVFKNSLVFIKKM